ncbi:MAG: hypothetical protein MUE41_16160 [Gemmatimonadaceae bacterium]|nr:hypothetical protein [Gemmatimonadaceae bacterium]
MIRLVKVAAVLMAVLLGLALLAPTLAVNTVAGRGWTRGFVERQLTGVLGGRGQIRIGELTTLSRNTATLRDVELRDRWGDRIARIGEARVHLALGPLLRKVLHFRAIDVRDVELDVVQRLDSTFNLVSLLPDSSAPRVGPPGWGDDVRADTLRIADLQMQVRVLWAPHRTFEGRERDSVTALYRTLHEVHDTAGQLVAVRRFARTRGTFTDARLVRPEGGGRLDVRTLATEISDPAMPITDARGTLEWTPQQQLRIDLSHLALPASRAAVRGTVGWRDPGPVRYDLLVPADSVALADINWVWPVLPRTGGGSARLGIRSTADADIVDYALDSLHVVAEGSDVRGRVTVRVAPRTVALSGMHLALAPLTTPVIRRILEGELPESLQGDVRGTVHAEDGGTIAAVRIDSATLAYRERDGTTARLAFAGVVGSGASTILRDVRVGELVLPLAIVRPLVAEWPAGLDGTLRASGLLSGDLAREAIDARGLRVQLTTPQGYVAAIDGRIAGSGLLGPRGRFDLALASSALDPRAFGALGDSLPIRGPLQARLAAAGTRQQFRVDAEARAPGHPGFIRVTGSVANPAPSLGVDLQVTASQADVRAFMHRSDLPTTAVDGALAVRARLTAPRTAEAAWRLDDGSVRGTFGQRAARGLLPLTFDVDAALDADALRVRQLELTAPSLRATAPWRGGWAR